MSANQIPNLNTLRRGGGGLRGRLRGRGGPGIAASVSRLSAVELGYLDDAFARALTAAGGGPGSRRFPIINRGEIRIDWSLR